ncbi:MAG: ribbon-helix-helix protein, CopG family [Ignisphaera sp.]
MKRAKVMVISFRVSPDEKYRIEVLCRARRHRDISSCIRRALFEYLGV